MVITTIDHPEISIGDIDVMSAFAMRQQDRNVKGKAIKYCIGSIRGSMIQSGTMPLKDLDIYDMTSLCG